VYAIRQHRTDDYQGRYRIWLLAAACWLLLATDQAASLREGFRDLMLAVSGGSAAGDGALWWAIVYALLFGALASRLLIDMYPSFLSMGFLLIAVTGQMLVVAGRFGWILPHEGSQAVMSLAGAEMIANVSLWAAMMVHARYVLFDAEGLLPRSEPEADEEPADEEPADCEPAEEVEDLLSSADQRWMPVDPPHTIPPPAFQRAASPTVSSHAASPSASTPFVPPVNRKLTKGERKALKERLLRERRQREGRG
jgi:hypothetical protein